MDAPEFHRVPIKRSNETDNWFAGEKHYIGLIGGIFVHQEETSSGFTSVFYPASMVTLQKRRIYLIAHLAIGAAVAGAAFLIWLVALSRGTPPGRPPILNVALWAVLVVLGAATLLFIVMSFRNNMSLQLGPKGLGSEKPLEFWYEPDKQSDAHLVIEQLNGRSSDSTGDPNASPVWIHHDWPFLNPLFHAVLEASFALALCLFAAEFVTWFSDSLMTVVFLVTMTVAITLSVGFYRFYRYWRRSRGRAPKYRPLLRLVRQGKFEDALERVQDFARKDTDPGLALVGAHLCILLADFKSARAWAEHHDDLLDSVGAPAQKLTSVLEAWYDARPASKNDIAGWLRYSPPR